jgi:hypothetical protein
MITYRGISNLAEHILVHNGGKVERCQVFWPPDSTVEFDERTGRHRVFIPGVFGSFVITTSGHILFGYPKEKNLLS